MTYSAEPGHVEQFRDATDNHEKMRGVPYITFKCRECHLYKSIAGRKARGMKAYGYRCADCHKIITEKSATVSADVKTAASSVR